MLALSLALTRICHLAVAYTSPAPCAISPIQRIKPAASKAFPNQFLPPDPGDCEPSEDPEDSGKGGAEVEFEYVLSAGPGDCELLVDLEVFGRGGVGVDSEYDLELRISSNMGRPEMVLTALKPVR
jgi:hypothetical protein